jgi:hypothetical protein
MADYLNRFETVACNFEKPTDDEKWINSILNYLIVFYNRHKNNTDFKDKTENQITDEIYFWLKNNKENKKFNMKTIVNSQPRSNNEDIEGYYDLKFEPREWRENDPHFAVENKILENTETSFKNYIYYPNKVNGKKENIMYFNDGGMYRFLSNKYVQGQSFGGMIAFIKKDDVSNIKTNLIEKIKNFKIPNKENFYGEILNRYLLDFKIQNFDNSFQSNHKRIDGTEIHLIHLLFRFNEE